MEKPIENRRQFYYDDKSLLLERRENAIYTNIINHVMDEIDKHTEYDNLPPDKYKEMVLKRRDEIEAAVMPILDLLSREMEGSSPTEIETKKHIFLVMMLDALYPASKKKI